MSETKVNNSTQNYLGYFGKVPMRGDFITHGLPVSFTEPWHQWIKQSLSSAKQQLGDDWMTHYLTTPIYHYVLSSDIYGGRTWLGVIMPSVDSAGRYYPMTLCRSFTSEDSPLVLLNKFRHWLEEAEKLLLSTLNQNATLEIFEQEFKRLAISAEEKQQATINIELEKRIDTLLFETYSLWSTQGSELITPTLLIANSLPKHQTVVAFMDGRWEKWGWFSEQIVLQ